MITWLYLHLVDALLCFKYHKEQGDSEIIWSDLIQPEYWLAIWYDTYFLILDLVSSGTR